MGQLELNDTWEEYVANCGSKVILANSIKANMFYETHYKGNIITWDGYHLYSLTLDDSKRHKNLVIKMKPSESQHYPDMILSIPKALYMANKAHVDRLRAGDRLGFQAVLKKIGDDRHFHLLQALELKEYPNETEIFTDLVHVDDQSIIHMVNG